MQAAQARAGSRSGAGDTTLVLEGTVKTYRYLEATRPRQVHLHIDRAGVVHKLAFTDEPGYADDPGASHP